MIKPFLSSALAAAMVIAPLCADAMVCSFTSVVGVSFGAYNVFSPTPVDTTGSVTYLCDTGPAGFVTIDISAGSSGDLTARTLTHGGDSLTYNLYSTALRTGDPWGDGTSNTTHYGPVLAELDTPTTITVYGRIPASQNVVAGSYGDTVVVTINF